MRARAVAVVMLLCLLVPSTAGAAAWRKYHAPDAYTSRFGALFIYGRPIINDGPSGAWDSIIADDPWLMQAGGSYYLYYYGFNWKHAVIGYATSADLLHWIKNPGNPVITQGVRGSFDSKYAAKASIIQIGPTYCAYYEAYDGGTKTIGLATAPALDAAWTKFTGNPVLVPGLEADGSTTINYLAPSVFENDGLFYLFYSGQLEKPDFRWCTYYATSTDGVSWTRQGVVIPPGPAKTWNVGGGAVGSVIKLGNDFVLSYNALGARPRGPLQEVSPSGIGLFSSTDLVNWSPFDPVHPLISTARLGQMVWRSHIANVNGHLWMFFGTQNGIHECIRAARFQNLISP